MDRGFPSNRLQYIRRRTPASSRLCWRVVVHLEEDCIVDGDLKDAAQPELDRQVAHNEVDRLEYVASHPHDHHLDAVTDARMSLQKCISSINLWLKKFLADIVKLVLVSTATNYIWERKIKCLHNGDVLHCIQTPLIKTISRLNLLCSMTTVRSQEHHSRIKNFPTFTSINRCPSTLYHDIPCPLM